MTVRPYLESPNGSGYPRPIGESPTGKLVPFPGATPVYRAPAAPPRARLPIVGAGGLREQVAPWPQIERYPIVSGRNVTLELISSRFRLALTGYRQLYVDLLNELIERDPTAFGLIRKLTLAVANAKYRAVPPPLPKSTSEADRARAEELADQLQNDTDRIPRWRQHLASLAWADYYGMQGAEMMWIDDPHTGRMRVREIVMIHSRRLSYPDPWRWDLYVWDQGAVMGSPSGNIQVAPGIFGWRLADYPGKFIVHTPQVRGDYPIREGLGRELAYWMALKHIAARAAPIYLDRFGSPPIDIVYRSGKTWDEGRPASDDDIKDANVVAALEVVKKWAHSDAVKWEIKSPDGVGGRAKVTFDVWMQVCDDQMAKAVVGNTLGTQVGSTGGNRALGGEQRKDTLTIFGHSSGSLADTLNEQYVATWCALNAPGEEPLWPLLSASVEDDPDPMDIMERAAKGAGVGLPIDADELGDMVGLPLVARDDEKARVLRPVQPAPPTTAPYAPLVAGNDEAAAEARAQQALEIASQTKPAEPPGAPPGTKTQGAAGAEKQPQKGAKPETE